VINSTDDLVGALGRAAPIPLYFPTGTTVAGGFTNLSRLVVGGQFGQIAVPPAATAGGHVPTDNLIGFPTFPNPGVGQATYLAGISLSNAAAGLLLIYDRVYAVSGFVGNVTTPQPVTAPPALPASRAPNGGAALEIWLESYTAVGATAANVTVTYINQDGVAGRTTLPMPITASFPAGRAQRLSLADGDTGVQAIEGVQLSASTGAAGNFGVVLRRQMTLSPLPMVQTGLVQDFADVRMPQVPDDAALEFLHLATGSATGVLLGNITLIQG
jgi:hypothetical protein